MAAAPAKPPEEAQPRSRKTSLAAILVGKEIPWVIQAALGASGYVTPAAARDNLGQWSPGPGIPGWREWIQRPDLGLHGNAPPSGSTGGSKLGQGGNQGDRPVGHTAPTKALLRSCVTGASWKMFPAKQIVSALPEEGERPSSTHKKITVDGWEEPPYISAPAGTIAPNL